jgi:hypothetical protein
MENLPKESETIAARRAIRLAEKLSQARESLRERRSWWSNVLTEVIALILVFTLNLYLVMPFFGSSVSDTFFSGPVFPVLAKFIEVFNIPLSYAIQIVNIIFFLLFPISLYFMVKFITHRKIVAIVAVLLSSLPFYPFGYVRLTSAFIGSDAAHIAGLSIIPIALLTLIKFIREGGIKYLIIASISSALVALTSPFAFMTYGMLAFILAFSETLLGKGRLKIFRTGIVFLFAGGLNSFWYNPSFFFWMLMGPLGHDIRLTVSKLFPISFYTLPVLATFGYLLFDRKPNLQPIFIAGFYTISFALIALAGGGIFPSHPSRYIAELGLSLSMLAAILAVKLFEYLKSLNFLVMKKFSKALVFNSITVLLLLFLMSAIFLGRKNLVSASNVLGAWEGIDKGEIWEAKDRFRGASSLLGHAITGATIISLAFVGVISKKAEPQEKDLKNDNLQEN